MATSLAPTIDAYEPRHTGRGWHRDDISLLAGSAISAGAITWLAIVQLTTIRNIVGLWAIWYVTFLMVYRLVTNMHQGRLAARDKMMTVLIATGALIVLTPLVFIISYVVAKGLPAINADFFTKDLSMTGTLDTGGGAAHAIVGTLEQIAIACLISVPLGVATAVFLNEVRGPLRRPVRLFVDAMSGVPSIVAGLFIFAVWIIQFGKSFSGFAAALAMSVLMLPSITRTSEEVLRLVPGGLREA